MHEEVLCVGRKDSATGICRVICEEVAKRLVLINYLLIIDINTVEGKRKKGGRTDGVWRGGVRGRGGEEALQKTTPKGFEPSLLTEVT